VVTTLLAPTDTLEVDADMDRRRFIIGGMSLAALLAACGGDSDSSGEGGGSAGSTPRTRTVTDSRGPSEVPASPQRIAALVGSAEIDVMLLGLDPVFSGTYAEGWVELPEGAVTSDTVPPSVEAVAAADPDLLIGWHWLSEEDSWVALGEIAPAVTLPDTGATWREVFQLVADAVNRTEQGEEVLAELDDRVAGLEARFAEREPITAALIGSFAPGTFWWWEPTYDTNLHMASVGIGIDGPAERGQDLSYERLGDVTAPWIILTGTPGTDDGTDDLMASPLWETLPAVQQDQVVVVDRDLWGGAGVMWAHRLLDELERIFLV
jgi:iron complex transport system substrate-binding protein